jgi:hypothetical protein
LDPRHRADFWGLFAHVSISTVSVVCGFRRATANLFPKAPQGRVQTMAEGEKRDESAEES